MDTTLQNLQEEVAQLREELKLREQLVQQLSQELFRLVKGKTEMITPSPEVNDRSKEELLLLGQQLEELQQQVGFYQEQIQGRDREIHQLRQTVQNLTDRTRMLEQVVQELPQIYRQKFAERMEAVRDKVEKLQRENRQLHAELQSISYRLAVKTRRQHASEVELPHLSPKGTGPIPTFGSV